MSGVDLADEDLVDGINYVSPGIDLHHFTFWRKPPTTQELICSGGIHAGLIIGDANVPANTLDFQGEMFSAFKDAAIVTAAPASEIMGGPLHSLRWLVSTLTRNGSSLTAGSFVIPGSPVELVVIDSDTSLKVAVDRVGELEVLFRKSEGTNRKPP